MLRRQTNHDLRYLLLASLLLGLAYTALRYWQPFRSGHGWGLLLGITGFTMMLGAQTLYTWRKHRLHHPPGPLYYWLRAHIALGLIGGLCAILHGGGQFAGIAGVAVVLTMILLLSGFVGRYLYTTLDRDATEWQTDLQRVKQALSQVQQALPNNTSLGLQLRELDELATPPVGWRLLLTRLGGPWVQHRRIAAKTRTISSITTDLQQQLTVAYQAQYDLWHDWESLVVLRRLFAWWYLLHVPLSWVAITLSVIHVFGVWRYWVN